MVGALKSCFVRENYVPCAKWFYGLTEGWEVFENLPGGGALHRDRVWARGDPRRPDICTRTSCSTVLMLALLRYQVSNDTLTLLAERTVLCSTKC